MTRFAARLGGFYAALFLIYGVHLPYLPVWLDWRGLSAGEIALVTAAPFFVRLAVTPLVAYGADRYRAHRPTVIGLAVLALAMALVLSQSHGFWPIMAAALVLALATTTIMPLTETIAVAGVRVGGLDYGRMRLWGSLTFIVASFGGGMLVDARGVSVGVWLIVAGAVVTVLAALALPELPRSPEELLPSERSEPAEDRLSVVRRLAGRADFLVFLAAVGAVQGAHALFYAFGALHWRSLGISGTWVGLLWTIGVLAEVAVFAYSRAILARIGAVELMIAGGAAATLRWAAMSIDPPIAVLVPLQLLHALSYGAAHLGAIHFIATTVPQQAAGTGQALYATIAAGVAMGAATLAAGPLYAHYAGQAYLAMAALALAGTMAAVVLWRLARSAVPPTERS